jgi:hypothetical protein
LYANFC